MHQDREGRENQKADHPHSGLGGKTTEEFLAIHETTAALTLDDGRDGVNIAPSA
jgi:hypothetical protein